METKINVIIFGSSGMIGQGVLRECLASNDVASILVVNRRSYNLTHPKLKEIIYEDLFDLYALSKCVAGYDTCFFCVGVTSAGLSEEEYSKMTYKLTTKIAEMLLTINIDFRFCYISGAGTDISERGRTMWARVKGKTENALLALPFKKAYMFRPGFIQPMHGIKSRTRLYNVLYLFFKPLYFILKHFKSFVTTTETLGKAMILAVTTNYEKNILESSDINALVKNHEQNN